MVGQSVMCATVTISAVGSPLYLWGALLRESSLSLNPHPFSLSFSEFGFLPFVVLSSVMKYAICSLIMGLLVNVCDKKATGNSVPLCSCESCTSHASSDASL